MLTLTIVAAGVSACSPGRATLPGAIPSGDGPALRVRVAGRITAVPLERYVLGAALSEITPTGESPTTVARIYDVQTVIARTWAVAHRGRHARDGFDLCDDTHCQLYQPDRIRTSSFSAAAQQALDRTRGRILRSGSAPIVALFHADCGGHTTTPSTAWGGTDLPYLPARPDEVPSLTHRSWTFEATHNDWRQLLARDPRTDVGAALTGIEVTRTGPGGRVQQLRLTGTRPRVVTGDVFRTVVSAARGPRSVLSTRFEIETTSTAIRLHGAGFGHGVGLCQVGALARARRGDSLAAILDHYFPGSQIGPWAGGR